MKRALLLLFTFTCAHAAEVSIALTDKNGAPVADAVVYLLPRAGGLPRKPARVDQMNKMFIPDVSVIPVGTAVSFPNSDNIRHHVYSFSPAKVFDLKLYSGKPAAPVVFDKPGVVTLGCNIHDQMIAWILVVDSNLFAKSNAQGVATIASIPSGAYALHAWHPGSESEAKPMMLSVTSNARVDLQFNAKSITQLRRELGLDGAR